MQPHRMMKQRRFFQLPPPLYNNYVAEFLFGQFVRNRRNSCAIICIIIFLRNHLSNELSSYRLCNFNEFQTNVLLKLLSSRNNFRCIYVRLGTFSVARSSDMHWILHDCIITQLTLIFLCHSVTSVRFTDYWKLPGFVRTYRTFFLSLKYTLKLIYSWGL